MDANGNSSAYPLMPPLDSAGDSARGYPYPESGLTKREAFAMAAMQALISTAAAPALGGLDGFEPHTAKAACRMADALLAELAKETP